ncbi:MAG: hypothetical protein AAFY71_01920 [Bacteroidota bacterium]
MLTIYVDQITPRLTYTLEVLFERMSTLTYTLKEASVETAYSLPAINYSSKDIPGSFSLYCEGLLEEDHIREVGLQHRSIHHVPCLAPSPSHQWELEFDPFAASFYLLSHYEYYQENHIDSYGRYEQVRYPSSSLQLEERPLVYQYLSILLNHLQQHYPSIKWEEKELAPVDITFDIDFPWKYLHKSAAVQVSGTIKDFLGGKWTQLSERINTYRSGKDPFYVFDELLERLPQRYTTFFFLLERLHKNDSRFTWRLATYRKLIKRISEKGMKVGIHPSFRTWQDQDQLFFEKTKLEEIIDSEVICSRQHFLRYSLPSTYRYLEQIGIREEYTQCLFQQGGFPCGMAHPWPWFDLDNNRTSELILHPTHLMDRSLLSYQKLNPDSAHKRFLALWEKNLETKAPFTMLFHNDSFSDSGEWAGWQNTMYKWLDIMSKKADSL